MNGYRALTDPTEVIAYIRAALDAGQIIGADTETMGPNGEAGAPALDRWHNRIVGFSVSARWGEAIYVPVAHDDGPNCPITPELRAVLAELLTCGRTAWHNGHFDAPPFCRLAGIRVAEFRAAHDTQLMAQCLGERSEAGKDTSGGLKAMAKKYLNVERPSFADLFPPKTQPAKRRFAGLPVDVATPYAAADADDVLGLVAALPPLLDHWQVVDTYRLEMGLFPEILWMEDRGCRLDRDYAKRCSAELARYIEAGTEAIYARITERLGRPPVVKLQRKSKGEQVWREEPLSLTSNDSLAALLFSEPPWGIGLHPIKLTGTQKPSVDEDVLSRLAVQEDWLEWLLEVRSAAKARGTYFDTFASYCTDDEPGQLTLHPNYKQFGAETGRTASSDPNVQNLPKEQRIGARKDGTPIIPGVEPVTVNTRDMLVPRPGYYFVDVDWAAVEYRIIAGFSQDPGLLEVFRKGIDIHVATYALMYGVDPTTVDGKQRSEGKTINYALNFGAGAERLAGMLGCSIEEAKAKIALYNQGLPLVASWKAGVEEFAKTNKYVQTLFGRKRWLNFGGAGINESAARKAFFAALREAVNCPVQGTAADLLKITLVRLGPWLRQHFPEVRTVLTTHDSITFEVPDSIDHAYFIEAVRPVVEFPWDWQPGWPHIAADFVHGRIGWGSLKGDDEDDAPAPTGPPATSADVAAIHEHNADVAAMRPPAAPLAPPAEAPTGRNMRLRVMEPTTMPQLQALAVFVQARPGPGSLLVEVTTIDQSYLMDGVLLTPEDRAAVAEATGWVQFHLEDRDALVTGAIAGTL